MSAAIVKEVDRIESDVSELQSTAVSYGLLNFLKFTGDIHLENIDENLRKKYTQRHTQIN